MSDKTETNDIDFEAVIHNMKPGNRNLAQTAVPEQEPEAVPKAAESTPAPEDSPKPFVREEIRASESVFEESITLRDRKPRPAGYPKEPEPTEGKEKNVPHEETRRRRPRSGPETQDYESLFIRTAPSTTRSGKAVYIRKEFHDRIMRIVQNIGFNEVSLFSYWSGSRRARSPARTPCRGAWFLLRRRLLVSASPTVLCGATKPPPANHPTYG